jgi:hypothetical protein
LVASLHKAASVSRLFVPEPTTPHPTIQRIYAITLAFYLASRKMGGKKKTVRLFSMRRVVLAVYIDCIDVRILILAV